MSGPLHILHIITRGDEAGGAQTHVRDLSMELARRGHRVDVAMGTWGILADQLLSAGIRCHHVPSLVREIDPRHDPVAIRNLARLMRTLDPNLVALHSSKAGMTGRVAARIASVPALFTAHGWAFNSGLGRGRSVYRWIERGCAPLAQRIICVSDHDRRIAIDAGIAERRLITIPNGIPDVHGEPPERRSNGHFRIISVARFAPPKDPDTVLRALAMTPGVTLDFVGDGPMLPAAISEAQRLGVSDRVRFLGRRDDVPALLLASDLFVLSSHSEGFPISTLEAMRAGLPVVVTDVGGAAESAMDGNTGLIIPPADPARMAAAFAKLAANRASSQAMGEAARAHYLARYTAAQMTSATEAVYRDVVTKPSRRQVGTFVAGLRLRSAEKISTGSIPSAQATARAVQFEAGKGMHRGD